MLQPEIKVQVTNSTGSTTEEATLYASGLIKFKSNLWSHIIDEKRQGKTILEVVVEEAKPAPETKKVSEPRSPKEKKK